MVIKMKYKSQLLKDDTENPIPLNSNIKGIDINSIKFNKTFLYFFIFFTMKFINNFYFLSISYFIINSSNCLSSLSISKVNKFLFLLSIQYRLGAISKFFKFFFI